MTTTRAHGPLTAEQDAADTAAVRAIYTAGALIALAGALLALAWTPAAIFTVIFGATIIAKHRETTGPGPALAAAAVALAVTAVIL